MANGQTSVQDGAASGIKKERVTGGKKGVIKKRSAKEKAAEKKVAEVKEQSADLKLYLGYAGFLERKGSGEGSCDKEVCRNFIAIRLTMVRLFNNFDEDEKVIALAASDPTGWDCYTKVLTN